MKNVLVIVCTLIIGLGVWAGCSSSEKSAIHERSLRPNEELALQHFLEGSLLDQKGDYEGTYDY